MFDGALNPFAYILFFTFKGTCSSQYCWLTKNQLLTGVLHERAILKYFEKFIEKQL